MDLNAVLEATLPYPQILILENFQQKKIRTNIIFISSTHTDNVQIFFLFQNAIQHRAHISTNELLIRLFKTFKVYFLFFNLVQKLKRFILSNILNFPFFQNENIVTIDFFNDSQKELQMQINCWSRKISEYLHIFFDNVTHSKYIVFLLNLNPIEVNFWTRCV